MTRPLGRVIAGALAGLLVLGTMSPAAAAKKPPKITNVTAASRLVDQGAPFPFTVSAKNSSTKRSAPLGLIFVLSESSDYDDGVVLGSGVLPALARKARVSASFSVTIPPAQPDDDYRLLVCLARAGKSPECRKNVAVDVEESATQPSGSSGGGSTTAPGSGSALPSSILNMLNWKLTLPVDGDGQTDERAAEVRQPALATYQHPTWFHANAAGTGVVFRAQANGATTSDNTQYARSELREMTSSGQTNASWSPTAGTHVMTLSQAITRLPGTSKPEVVAGQIHDGSDDVLQVRLEGRRLFLSLDDGEDEVNLATSYTLGTPFTVKITSTSAGISVTYDGAAKLTNFKPASAGSSWYFKAGCYTQSNESGTYSEVVVYGLSVAHS